MGRPAAFITVATAAIVLALAPAATRAADPDAPPGAPAAWLPPARWVGDHWLPYDETRLYALLRVDRKQVLAWVRDESHDLGDLARRQGVSVRTLPARLVGPRGHRPRALYRKLLYRAGKTLTQPHLSRHMWGHTFHVGSLNRADPRIFNMPIREIVALRRNGMSYAQVAERGGRTRAAARADILAVLRGTLHHAAATGQMPRSQARRWLAFQKSRLDQWLDFVPRAVHEHGGESPMAAASIASSRWAVPADRTLTCVIHALQAIVPQRR